MIIDLTGIADGTRPARLLGMVEDRSKQAFKQWLSERPQAWRDGIEIVAMYGFTGFKTATTEELPDATTVMDPFHVVRKQRPAAGFEPASCCAVLPPKAPAREARPASARQ